MYLRMRTPFAVAPAAMLLCPLLLVACASPDAGRTGVAPAVEAVLDRQALQRGSWEVYAIGDWRLDAETLPRIAFGSAGQVGGQMGCNRFLGRYRLDAEGALSLDDMRLTHHICAGPVMYQEGVLLNWLRDAWRSRLTDDGELLIYSGQRRDPIRLRPAPDGG